MSRFIVGVDEVGRGCLAGPVYAAAVILPSPHPDWVAQVRDSKKVAPAKRARLAQSIQEHCKYAVRDASPNVIDEMNILYASLWAMGRAVDTLYLNYGAEMDDVVILVDGNKAIPTEAEAGHGWMKAPWKQITIPGGDNLEKSIGAASIVAKVHRDRFMTEFADQQHPEYGFARHVGYGTQEHREAIQMYGPCPLHRKTFSGVYQYVRN